MAFAIHAAKLDRLAEIARQPRTPQAPCVSCGHFCAVHDSYGCAERDCLCGYTQAEARAELEAVVLSWAMDRDA